MVKLLKYMFTTSASSLFVNFYTHYNATFITPNCVMTPKLILYDHLYSPGVVSFHSSPEGVLFVVDKDHPHYSL